MTVSVAFRTLTQVNFNLVLEDSLTIADVKTKIAEGRGAEFAPEHQKLIYNGKILDDNSKVSEVGFDASKFVVVMLAKKKATETAPAPVVEPTPSVAAPEPVVEPPVAAPVAVAAADALTSEQEASVSAIVGMGYLREQAVAALRAAFWNADRAVEFLLNGIPDDLIEHEPAALGAQNIAELDDDANEDLNMLANMPQLNEIRGLIQQNPEMLAVVLQQIAAANPRLVQTIQNNQQAFMDILNGAPNAAPEGGAQGGNAGAEAGRPRRHVIQISGEEAEAIERIKAIVVNAPEALVVEAYFACDKNEEAAINFIFNSLDEQ